MITFRQSSIFYLVTSYGLNLTLGRYFGMLPVSFMRICEYHGRDGCAALAAIFRTLTEDG